MEKPRPWFILGVMLFSYAVRAVYIEACAMFTRGGVYGNVKEPMGGAFAKISVSALMFDYILIGPISGVSAGQYIVNLLAQTLTYLGHPWHPTKQTINLLAAGIAILIIVYFWWRNTQGIHESSDDALKIMYVTTAMIVTLILWCGITILVRPDKRQLPPAPVPANLSFNRDAVGWLPDIAPRALRPLPSEAHPASRPSQTSHDNPLKAAPCSPLLRGIFKRRPLASLSLDLRAVVQTKLRHQGEMIGSNECGAAAVQLQTF